jgi:hypothetical protein
MNLSNKAASFFLCGDNISEDFYKLCEAADNDAAVPEDVDVWQPFEDEDAQTLVDYIFDLKNLLMEVRDRTIFETKFNK